MKRILIVDDIEENCYLLRVLLEGYGYEVEQARDGSEAIAKALEKVPDLIISDILMPIMDGYALCRKWKADERLKQAPFIFYTATYTDIRDEQLAIDMGADAFIIKPTEPDEFLRRIETIFTLHKNGMPASPKEPKAGDESIIKHYNEALIRKLEQKMLEIERVNRELGAEIAAKNKMETILRDSEEKFKAIADYTVDFESWFGPDGKYIWVNRAVEQITGYSAEEILAMPNFITTMIAEEDRMRFTAQFREAIMGGRGENYEFRFLHKNGSMFWMGISWQSIFDGKGNTLGIRTSGRDITERKLVEEELQRQLKELKRWQSVMLDREDRVIGLKKEINSLLKEMGRPGKYSG